MDYFFRIAVFFAGFLPESGLYSPTTTGGAFKGRSPKTFGWALVGKKSSLCLKSKKIKT